MIKENKVCAGYGFMECSSLATFNKLIEIGDFTFSGSIITCVENIKGVTLNLYKEEMEKRKVYVIGVPKSMKDHQLIEVFGKVGEVERAYTVKKGKKNQSKHFAFVIFRNLEDAEKAIQKRKFKYKKFKLNCKRFETKKDQKKDEVKAKKRIFERKDIDGEQKKFETTKLENEPYDVITGNLPLKKPQPQEKKQIDINQHPKRNFNLDLLINFTDFPNEPNIHTPPPESDSISQRSLDDGLSFTINEDQEGNNQQPLSVYTKCCINYVRPPTPEESVIEENPGSGINNNNIDSENGRDNQNLARIFLDEEFFEKGLKVGEMLGDKVSWKIRNENHRFGNLRMNGGSKKPNIVYRKF